MKFKFLLPFLFASSLAHATLTPIGGGGDITIPSCSASQRITGDGSDLSCAAVLQAPTCSAGQAATGNGSTLSCVAIGTGDVVGPASATDNAICRFDSTTGKLVQNSSVTIDDTGHVLHPDGNATNPPVSFTNNTGLGLYRAGSNSMGVGVGGTAAFLFNSGGFQPQSGFVGVVNLAGTALAPSYTFSGDLDTGWWHPSSNTLGASIGGDQIISWSTTLQAQTSPNTSGVTASMSRTTGNSSTNNSGDITDTTGTAANGVRGKISQNARVVDQSGSDEGTILANLAADPASNVAGTAYYDTNTGNLRSYDGVNSAWKFVGADLNWTTVGDDQKMNTIGIPLLNDGIRSVSIIDPSRMLSWGSDFFQASESAFWNSNLVGSSPTSGYHSLFVSPTSPGIWLDGSGLDVTGRVVHYTSSSLMLGAATVRFVAKVRPEELATAPQDYEWFFGLGNTFTDSTDFSNGVYFKYNRSVSVNWLCGTAEGGSRTEADSGVPVTADDFAVLTYVVAPDISQVEFFIDGTLVCTNTTNLPTDSEALNGVYKFFKTNGNDEKRITFDYTWIRMDFATPR